MSIMSRIKEDVNKITGTINMATHSFGKDEQQPVEGEITQKMTALSRQAAAEGAVLLKNNGVAYPT